MVSITIDNKKTEVPEGTTVLQAAEAAGIHIPTLCHHPKLIPYGGCRLCLVEIEGARTLQPSCTLPVSNNMVIHTDTQKVLDARKFVLTMIFSERNHFCPYCQVSGGDCELQNSAYGEGMTNWPLQPNYKPYPVDASNPFIIIEHNRCILCRRCVRACGELVGNFTLGFEERGAASVLVADLGTPLGESSCVSCGTCVQICPTGALIDRWSAYKGHEKDVDHTKTVCVGCSMGCGLNVLSSDNRVVRIDGDWDGAVSGGVICKVGRFLPMSDDRNRIATPLVRKDGVLKAATWDDAIETAINGLKSGSAAAMASTRLTAETLYAFKQLFADKLNYDVVTTLEEGISTTVASKVADAMGKSFEGNLDTLKKAGAVLVIGTDLTNNHEVAGFFIKRLLPSGVKFILVDPKENPLDVNADFPLKAAKGANINVIEGLSAAVVKLGLAKRDNALKSEEIIKNASEKTGIDADTLLSAAYALASSTNPVIVYGKDVDEATLKALIELARLAGVCTDDHSGLVNLKGMANSMVAAQYHLEKPIKLNGHKAAYVALGDDDPSQQFLQSLEKVGFKVVQASYASKLTAMADVVLPVETWIEQDGHFLSMEGRLQKSSKVINAPADVRSNTSVLETIASKMGVSLDTAWKEELTKRVPSVSITEVA